VGRNSCDLRLSLRRFSRNSKCPNRTAWIFCTTLNFRQIGTQIRTVHAEVRTHPSASRILPNSRWTDRYVKWLLYSSGKGFVECSVLRTDGQTLHVRIFPPSLRTHKHEQFLEPGAEIRVRSSFAEHCALYLFWPLTGHTPLPSYTKIRRGPRRKFWAKEEVAANWRPNIVHLYPSRTGYLNQRTPWWVNNVEWMIFRDKQKSGTKAGLETPSPIAPGQIMDRSIFPRSVCACFARYGTADMYTGR